MDAQIEEVDCLIIISLNMFTAHREFVVYRPYTFNMRDIVHTDKQEMKSYNYIGAQCDHECHSTTSAYGSTSLHIIMLDKMRILIYRY